METEFEKHQKNESKLIKERDLETVMAWVTERLKTKSDVPRVSDVVHYAYSALGFKHLKRGDIARRLRLHPAYLMTSQQTRGRNRWKRYRPVIANALGMLHGDIGFFAVTRAYETPVTYRAGFLVLKDVLSRFTYIVALRRNRTADSMIRAFREVLEQHVKFFGDQGHRIKSIAFDREKSVTSNKVQEFFRQQNIAFHPFKYTSSKSKFAEGAIRQIRTLMARLQAENPDERWWRLTDTAAAILNSQNIVVHGKRLDWRPRDVNVDTLRAFRRDLLKADPSRFFGQFTVSPLHVKFNFPVGTVVRPKLLVTSSAAIGEKRSQTSLVDDYFVVTEQLAYVNAKLDVGRAYRCVNPKTREEEIFDQDDLAESSRG